MPMPRPLTRATFLRTAAATALALAAARHAIAELKEQPMLTRPIPSTGAALPVIGLGTWQSFDVGSAPEERAPLAEVLRVLFAAGGSVIDSSPMYGRAEGVVGDLLAAAGSRSEAFLATKVWTTGRAAGLAQMERSLMLFQTPRLELMEIHNLLGWKTQLASLRQ
jgi:diketogulonate reductase-like aldo/keto reductase